MYRDAAALQVVLEGVPLPAGKKELIAYAREQDGEARLLALLERIEEGEYRRIDEVGEAVAGVQPSFAPPSPHQPHVESDEPPGGASYTELRPEPGEIREPPVILEYEEQLVREPAPIGEGIPKKGSEGTKPGA